MVDRLLRYEAYRYFHLSAYELDAYPLNVLEDFVRKNILRLTPDEERAELRRLMEAKREAYLPSEEVGSGN